MQHIWIIGTGGIGEEYARILHELGKSFIAIGRSEEKAQKFEVNTSFKAVSGGLDQFLSTNPQMADAAIVATGIRELLPACKSLIAAGISQLLIEKPGGLHESEIAELAALCDQHNVHALIAYNRRFYGSVMKAQDVISKDGGLTSFHFEFTEWSHRIAEIERPAEILRHWFLGNSTHVADTAFFVGGWPEEFCSFRSGNLSWHPTASVFTGAGKAKSGALFSYEANWESAGRWSIVFNTFHRKLILMPMEGLFTTLKGRVDVVPMEFDNTLDTAYKPGFYLQTKAFVEKEHSRFCTIQEQLSHIKSVFNKIAGY